LCYDVQGVHVVEKVISCIDWNLIEEAIDQIITNFIRLAIHCNGLCVIKKLIAICKSQMHQIKIMRILIDNYPSLIQHPFGNYAIQTAVECWDYNLMYFIFEKFTWKCCNFSLQKYSSNVIEKCLEKGGELFINNFVDEVCSLDRAGDLMKNGYGNYVMQKALKVAKGNTKTKLISILLKNIQKIGDRKLILKWKNILEAHLMNAPLINSNYTEFNRQFKGMQYSSQSQQPTPFSFNFGFDLPQGIFHQKNFKSNSNIQLSSYDNSIETSIYMNPNYVLQKGGYNNK